MKELADVLRKHNVDPKMVAKFIEESLEVEMAVLWADRYPGKFSPSSFQWYPERKERMIQVRQLAILLSTI